MIAVRLATSSDAHAVAEVFLASFRAAYPSLRPIHSDDQVRAWIRDTVIAGSECWVAIDEGEIVAMMALTPGWIDHLYVAPDRLGERIGSRLLALAKDRAGGPLELWTFQANERARGFYARNGFREVELTDGSGNDDHEPDVRLVWSPHQASGARVIHRPATAHSDG